ncbi:MAG: hypothetical protein QXQ54_08530 [Thermoplasmata archaeon]
MRIDDKIRQLVEYRSRIQAMIKLLKTMRKLDSDNCVGNLSKLKRKLKLLEGACEELKTQSTDIATQIHEFVKEYGRILDVSSQEKQKMFGIELEEELKKVGITLSGHYPDLHAGFFTIGVDFEKGSAIIWYGPKEERLQEVSLSIPKIVKVIQEIKNKLGSPDIAEDKLCAIVREAYQRVLKRHDMREGKVPIGEIMYEVCYLRQSPKFRVNPTKENFRGYSRADFSYDLFRLSRANQKDQPCKIVLSLSSLANTRRREDYLWVMESEDGKGKRYSYLEVR